MPKTIKYTCDGCGKEPDVNKNFLMVSGSVIKFTPEGLKRFMLEKYFCDICADKILQVIEQINEPRGTNS